MEMDLYARIYLDTMRDKASLAGIVSGIVGGLAAGDTIVTELAEIFVSDNDDFADGLGHYRYCLEIEPLEAVDAAAFIGSVANLIAELRDAGFQAVAESEFGDMLPGEERHHEGSAQS